MNNKPTIQEAHQYIGTLITKFAYAELALELSCAFIMRNYDSAATREWPDKRLNQKVKYFRRAAASFAQISKHRIEMETVADKFDALADDRHGIVHGALSIDRMLTGILHFRRHEIENGVFVDKETVIKWADADKKLLEFSDLEWKSKEMMEKFLGI